jgi:hypothetical protein
MNDSPTWIDSLIMNICDSIEGYSVTAGIGSHHRQEDELLELIIHPISIELVGGAEDGAEVVPEFSLDVQSVLAALEQVDAVYWFAHGFGPYNPEGPNISIEGIYEGHEVWIRILAYPPEGDPPGMHLDTLAIQEETF